MKGILTLCGPTKFYKTFDEVMLELTKADYGVFSIGSHRGADSSLNPNVYGYRPLFERLHRDKIAKSDGIVVINKNGYFGEHTFGEIVFARAHQKKIYWYDYLKHDDVYHWASEVINKHQREHDWKDLLDQR